MKKFPKANSEDEMRGWIYDTDEVKSITKEINESLNINLFPSDLELTIEVLVKRGYIQPEDPIVHFEENEPPVTTTIL